MKAIELYKFVKNNKIEWHWNSDNTDVILLANFEEAKEFNKLLGVSIFDDGIECTMKCGYLVFEMNSICEYFGLELRDIFTENEDDF